MWLFKISIIFLIVNEIKSALVTDFQQIDSNILENANTWFINRIDAEAGLEFSVIVNSDYATEQYLTEALQEWIDTKDSTIQNLFYYWIEDLKRQSQISRKTYEDIATVLPYQVSITFRRALVRLLYNPIYDKSVMVLEKFLSY